MKMRITVEDISKLTDAQGRRLTELWKPEKYDIAAAIICKDADNEEYVKYEFVIGNVLIDNYAHMYLVDIRAQENTAADEAEKDIPEEEITEAEEDDTLEESNYFEPEFIIPTCFNKEECIPLLNIGQIIDILSRNGFGEGDFYMTAGTAEIGCELGKNAANFNMYSSDYENYELCDVLFELLKTIL